MVGHALIKKMMKEKKAAFASELSLHLYFGDMYDVESSDLAFLYILQLLSREQNILSELIVPLQKYVHSGEINFTVTDKAATIARVRGEFLPQMIREEHIDGLWMQFDWGWMSVRESNTEPVLRLNLETSTPEITAKKVAQVKSLIEQ
jgi:phosphomannomutase